MNVTRTRFVIAVLNLRASAAFYRDVLGFKIVEIDDSGWLFYQRDDCLIMAGECPEAIPPAETGFHSYFAYLQITDIDAYHAGVVAAGAQLCKPLRDEPWGMREFGLVTGDGHRIMFGSPL